MDPWGTPVIIAELQPNAAQAALAASINSQNVFFIVFGSFSCAYCLVRAFARLSDAAFLLPA
jgi:hypothetical protein